jgi:hypothetical protein
MSNLDAFLAVVSVVCASGGVIAAVGTGSFWLDRVAVVVLRCSGLGPALFPTAVGLAVLIVTHPEQWSSDKYHLRHPDIGSVWIRNGAYGLHVETAMGEWRPNWIERRIIRQAVDWRLSNYIRDRLEVAVRKNALR